jgi:hypothetical protein
VPSVLRSIFTVDFLAGTRSPEEYIDCRLGGGHQVYREIY